jgi:hypothetical protein
VIYEIPDGKRLLSVSRKAKERILLLATVCRLTDDARFAQRAWQELDAVTRFKDWNPSHFLDTAEMTLAVSLGYDWLFDRWSTEQRKQLEDAIIQLGLNEGLKVYRKHTWWSVAKHNWNQVCNGGMTVGALAVADTHPDIAAEVLTHALQSLPLAMREFAPDGGWGEGPGYWRYATEYNVFMLAALQTALGTTFALDQLPGFPQTGDFPTYFLGPTGKTFNYADAGDGWSGAPQLYWLATQFRESRYAAAQFAYANQRPSPLDLVWGAAWVDERSMPANMPLARHFAGISVVTMRSAWNQPDALFVGFKGGDNRVNHGQLDLGSFVLESHNVRWAIDLGADDYNIPGYFGKQRWSYYRNQTAGHNTLLVDGQNQALDAKSQIVAFREAPNRMLAVADLTQAYPVMQRMWRRVALVDQGYVVIQDEFEANDAVQATWNLHTQAEVHVDAMNARLTEAGHTLYAKIIEPTGAVFTVQEAATTPPQKPLKDVRRLSIEFTEPLAELRLIVVMAPASMDSLPASLVPRGLADW